MEWLKLLPDWFDSLLRLFGFGALVTILLAVVAAVVNYLRYGKLRGGQKTTQRKLDEGAKRDQELRAEVRDQRALLEGIV